MILNHHLWDDIFLKQITFLGSGWFNHFSGSTLKNWDESIFLNFQHFSTIKTGLMVPNHMVRGGCSPGSGWDSVQCWLQPAVTKCHGLCPDAQCCGLFGCGSHGWTYQTCRQFSLFWCHCSSSCCLWCWDGASTCANDSGCERPNWLLEAINTHASNVHDDGFTASVLQGEQCQKD